MGVTYVPATISNPRRPDLGASEQEFLVDTGAMYSVLPASALDELGVQRLKLGLMVNPVTRERLPMRLVLARAG